MGVSGLRALGRLRLRAFHHVLQQREAGEQYFRRAIELAPDSPIAHIEMANGLVMLHGRSRVDEAAALYEKAAAMTPRDAMEKLDVERARAELE